MVSQGMQTPELHMEDLSSDSACDNRDIDEVSK